MKTLGLTSLFVILVTTLSAQEILPFFVQLNPDPSPTAIDPICSTGENTVRVINFSIADDTPDNIATLWHWEIIPESDNPDVVPPRLDTDLLEGQLSGSLNDGVTIADELFINATGATGGYYQLILSVQSEGLDNEQLYEYQILVGNPTFTPLPSAQNSKGQALICRGPDTVAAAIINAGLTRYEAFEPYSFAWSRPGIGVIGTEEEITVDLPLTYTLQVTNGCGALNTKSIQAAIGQFPKTAEQVYPLAGDTTFYACPEGMVYLEAAGKNFTGFIWQVRPPGDEDFTDLLVGTMEDTSITVMVDDVLHQDGSEYRVKVDNDGCSLIAGPDTIDLVILSEPQLPTTTVQTETLDETEMITFTQVVANTFGSNTGLLFELLPDGGTPQPILTMEGDTITAADADMGTFSGEIVLPPTNVTIAWEIAVTTIFEDIISSRLTLTYQASGSTDAAFDVCLRVINFDDNDPAFSGLPRETCFFGKATLADLVFLPIELLSFEAIPQGHSILLQWVTASELNNASFTIERSVDGVQFEAIHVMPGAGTTSRETAYSFLDDAPVNAPENFLYYRLKQTDTDGQFSYSPVVSVPWTNPSMDFELLQLKAQGGQLEIQYQLDRTAKLEMTIFDVNGRPLAVYKKERDIGLQHESLRLPDLPHGIYMLRLQDASRTIVRRFWW